MMEEYFALRDTLKLATLIIDIRHKPTDDDVMMYEFLKHYQLPVLVVATKLDKIPKNKKKCSPRAGDSNTRLRSRRHGDPFFFRNG